MSETNEWPEAVLKALADQGINVPGSGDPPPAKGKDSRIVYGVGCTWWDDIYKIGRTPPALPGGHRLPCCPHCSGLLMEMQDMAAWMKNVDRFEAAGHPGYSKLLEWQRGKCFKTMAAARAAYTAETGIALNWNQP